MATLPSIGSNLVPTAPLQGLQQPGSIEINESTLPIVILNADDPEIKESMRIAFAILQHIRSLKLPSLKGGRIECIRSDLFEAGPAWRSAAWESATTRGFILDMSGGSPSIITSLGQWPTGIVSHKSYTEVTETVNSLQEPLGLKLIQDLERVEGWGEHGPYYSINQWEGKPLPRPFYREKNELIPQEKIKMIWKELSPEFFPKAAV